MSITTKRINPVLEGTLDLKTYIAKSQANYGREEAKELLAFESMQPASQRNVESHLKAEQATLRGMMGGIIAASTEAFKATIVTWNCDEKTVDEEVNYLGEMALESAAWTLNLSGDTKSYGTACTESMAALQGEVMVNNASYTGLRYGMEAFDNSLAITPDYIASLAVFNAQSVFTDPVQAVFFPPTMINPGVTGLKRVVRITRVYTPTVRPTFAGSWEITRRKITDAITDPSFLNYPVIECLPVSSVENDVFLVAPSVIPNIEKQLDGELVNIRPIKFDTDMNLISISILPSQLQQNNVFDETDSLSNIVNVGDLYYRVTITGPSGPVSAVYKTNVQRQQRSQLAPRIDGNPFDIQTLMDANLTITEASIPVVGDHTAVAAAARSIFSLDVSIGYKIVGISSITAKCNTEFGNYKATGSVPTVQSVYSNTGVIADSTTIDSSLYSGKITFELLGSIPVANKTNNNLRLSGIMIDNNVQTTYLLPVLALDPISAKLPLDITVLNSEEVVTRFEDLAQVHRLRSVDTSIKLIQKTIDEVKAGDTFPQNSSYIALEWGVKPRVLTHEIDVNIITSNIESTSAMADVQSSMTGSITALVNQLLEETKYAAVLQAICGNNEAFTIIIACGPTIFPYLMQSGDPRTFGNKRPYQIVQSYHKDMKDKIWISFKTNLKVEGGHDLDFGIRLLKPAYTFDIPVQKNGTRYRQLQLVPVESQYVKLPVMIDITVKNLLSFFTGAK